ncbi:MAG: hypothetical protein ACE5DM_03545 [Candidatus Nanoarchaeia archaeon]
MQVENLVTCEQCSTKVSMKGMKFDLSGTSLICSSCYDKQKKSSTHHFTEKELGPSLANERRVERSASVQDYIFYQCASCSYSFSRKAEFIFKKCPNCSSETISVKQGNSAKRIVEGSDDNLDLGIDFI